ncbi:sporulation integral membrane protein YlbJ [Paenibacillus methanolicus]|uniref:Sporulation integral membrane protein YlbJ n=1 Tax=Paenibacillus methanolicus TaxID=582686 RepID=A0A5S5BXM7_9BACL|nr:sporulation integral membrane protein YlbJ [Paenibacillus methanolicus]TYP71787.1 sporulation integral membrane protein YlbJ [Paenibacillus methanolicus]
MQHVRFLFRPQVIPAWTAVLLALLLAAFPSASLQAAVRGLSIWWEVLFPALFPFFVISEVLIGFGIVHFFGTLLDPLMRPLFRIPGSGAFVFAMGFASGYPVGARLTSQLWDQRLISRAEGERLVAITTTSDPIFLIGAVSVGFFHNAALAPVLAAAHYGGAMIIGLLMRFHDRRETGTPVREAGSESRSRPRMAQAFTAMHRARLLDGRPVGALLQDAVQSALKLMVVVGGLVVFFSVVMELATSIGLLHAIASGISAFMHAVGMPAALAEAVVNGLFEVTLGAKTAGAAAGSGLLHQTAIAAFILSWGGLSVHAQVVSLLSRTALRYKPFLIARLAHGCLAALLVYALWSYLGPAG